MRLFCGGGRSCGSNSYSGWGIGSAYVCQADEAYHLSMSRIRAEFLDLDPSDFSVAADLLLRQAPDEEEDEEEDEDERKKEDNDDDDDETDDGYSE